MSRYVNAILAERVTKRADGRCEYCLIATDDTYFGGEIDHIRSLKHGGKTTFDNLALACQPCNRKKGTDLGSVLPNTHEIVRFFNPRIDLRAEHFKVDPKGEIGALTEIGKVTADIFGFNDRERVAERKGLIEIGYYIT
ncbi:HNH endonuclease signature motif containing protein [soil metagenome]